MAHPVHMPQAGQSMTEGKIVRWHVREGASVRRGEPLLEIETDKANMDVEAPADGVLRKVLFAEGATVAVKATLAVIGAAEEKIDLTQLGAAAERAASLARAAESPAGAAVGAASAKPPAAVAAAGNGRGGPRASPLARRVARLRGVDLQGLRGSGPNGRIIRRDVESAPAAAAPARDAAPGSLTAAGPAAAVLPSSLAAPYPPPSPRPAAAVPMSGMRKAIALGLQRSKAQAPHFYIAMEVDLSAALSQRAALKATAGLQASVNDLIVHAAALALVDEPRVNCRVFDDRVEYPPEVNIGIAVGLDEGLVVPVLLRAHERNLRGIVEESKRLIDSARAGKLIGSGQGTFTISNLGMFGVESFSAIINPPEGAILAVGAAQPRLVPIGGGFFPRQILKLTLSADHRAIDGVLAARFLGRLKHILESPERWLR